MYESADQCWNRLAALKQPLIDRAENYASLTIPSICLPQGFDPVSTDQAHDYQSIGAQAVNNVTNKLMLALFAPSRPFFKAKTGAKTTAAAAEQNITETDLANVLADIERQAISKLDELAQRPKLYATVRNLVVTGNVLLCRMEDSLRTMGLKYYCVKRTADGRVHTLIIREQVKFDELDTKVKAVVPNKDDDSMVSHYKLIRLLPSGSYGMSQWVDAQRLPTEFDGRWPADKMPYHALAWNLADESDYGTGLVEEYVGDLEAASVLSEAVVNGGILGAEYRWLVNPTGMTTADDFNGSKNGDALPGREEDIKPTQGGNPDAIKVAMEVLSTYEKRIARGFLLGSAITRDAERVTAEEVRLTANELETSFGGVYSTLAATLQTPIAWWLLSKVDRRALKSDLVLTIVTGLDALSRNGDLENLRLAFADLTALAQAPELLQERINWDTLADFIGQGRGVALRKFLLSSEQVQQNRAQAAQQEVATQTGIAAGQSAVDPANQPQ